MLPRPFENRSYNFAHLHPSKHPTNRHYYGARDDHDDYHDDYAHARVHGVRDDYFHY